MFTRVPVTIPLEGVTRLFEFKSKSSSAKSLPSNKEDEYFTFDFSCSKDIIWLSDFYATLPFATLDPFDFPFFTSISINF